MSSKGGNSSNRNRNRNRKSAPSEVSSSPAPLIDARLPAYLADAFGDLYGEDGLAVLGRGLGLLSLIAAFVRFYADPSEGHAALVREEDEDEDEGEDRTNGGGGNATAQSSSAEGGNTSITPAATSTPPLVFVIGLREAERTALVSTLVDWGTPPELLPTLVTNESGQGKDRAALYQRGGVFIITSRILIVDLLTQVANPRDIEGLLVAHAERVTEQSTDAFILRIYRTQKQWDGTGLGGRGRNPSNPLSPTPHGFVKAFTDAPDVLMSGFAKVDKILKSCHVKRLYLYPRFHDAVAKELERFPPYVDELHQELTPKMKEIQNAIAAAVQTCIRELKNSTTLIEWNDTDLTLENCVTTNFDMAISRQLEHDWHRLKPQTKQLVNDLRTLRTLFQYLIQYDCIAFYKLINSIKTMSAAARNPSMWLLTPAGDLLFRKAKERIYTIYRSKPTAKVPSPISRLKPILEENPKWRLLSQVLTEIKNEWKKRKDLRMEKASIEPEYAGGARILVMVKDERTLEAVRAYLVDGKDRTMTLRWLRYLEQFNDRSRAVAKSAGGSSNISEESRLLLEEEGRARNFLFGPGGQVGNKGDSVGATVGSKRRQQPMSVPDWKKKQRKVTKERSRGKRTLQSDDLNRRAVLDEALEETEHDLAAANNAYSREQIRQIPSDEHSSGDVSSDEEDELPYKIDLLDELRVVLRTYSSVEGEQSLLLLGETKPEFVVLYDADTAFIRSLEIHASSIGMEATTQSKHDRLRVFFMLFEASSEEKNFLKALEREQCAFERLIFHKKSMPLPLNTLGGSTQEIQEAMGGAGGTYAGGTLPLSMDTRTGRGKQSRDKERRDIAVDVREFRSSLPNILHQGGMRLCPVTLTVGDFVLSNVHCVERKSISDLFQSFASGRLYSQAESMCKHYKCPSLLIEFDPGKSFSLQNENQVGGDIRTDGICSKMSLLVMHFPRLRILWSRSPHETLKVFKALKANHEEVDVDKAMEIGSNESLDALLGSDVNGGDEENEVNEAARDMLLRLPGVTVHSARKIMNSCDSIAELVDMPRDELKQLVGPITGQKLFTFFRQKLGGT